MGNTRDTGYLRDIVIYDGSDNVTFPANVSLVAPGGSDNSTKVPSTAWVRTYVSGVASLSTSGTSGANGSSGSSGSSGQSGAAGSSGSSGSSGTSGSAGTSGSSGNAGSSGSSGSSGQSGAAGSSGSSGSTGTSGSSGSSGQTGAAGSSGSSGSSGSTGTSGSSGSSGQTGAAGSSGSSGSSGSTGTSGSSGSSGQTGAAGSSGSSGQSGAAGSSGSSGQSGAAGSSGSSGSSGQTGAAGSSGSSGSSGQTGGAGSSGSSGQTGGAGSSGTSGTSPSAAAYVAKAGDTMTGLLQLSSQATINTTTPGVGNYGLHFTGQTTADYAAGITWNGGTGTTGAQAGIYVQGSGSYGTKMYIATTDSYAAGSKTAISIDHMGLVNFIRAVPTYAGTSLVYNSGTWSISISGNATTATTATNSSQLNGISSTQIFNNMGNTHGSRTAFDASSPSYDFGFRYVQGTGNGPNTGGQYYSWYIGLGIDYPATGAGSYGMYVAINRTAVGGGNPYLTVRYNENNTLGSWSKISAGYADTAGTATDSSKLPLTGGTITGTLSMATTGTNYIRMGVFPNSTANSGEAWIGRASDRNAGTMTVQLGGNSPSGRSFEVVDYAWSVVLFNVNSNGTATASGDLIAYSDARVKTNIKSINNSLEKVLKLNGVTYNRIDSEDKSTKIGFIAQDVEKVVPEVVTYDGKIDRYGISYGNVAALLVEAIKEQQTQIEDQALEIRNLKALVGSLLGKNYK